MLPRRPHNDVKTLRDILDYNDRIVRQQKAIRDGQTPPSLDTPTSATVSNEPRTYTLNHTTTLSVLNWNEVFTNDRVISCMCFLFLMIFTQLMFSYIAFCVIQPQDGLAWFHISMFVNLVFAYMMPFSLIRDFDEVVDTPLTRLSAEIDVYKQLQHNSYFFFICTIISIIAVHEVFTGGPFLETDTNLETGLEIARDLTSAVRVLQLISFQLTLINFLLCLMNLFIADRKIRVCFNRIERMQNREDLEIMFNDELLDKRFKTNFF